MALKPPIPSPFNKHFKQNHFLLGALTRANDFKRANLKISKEEIEVVVKIIIQLRCNPKINRFFLCTYTI